MTEDAHQLRTIFNEDAEAYHRSRPVAPPELFDDLVALTGLDAGDQVLEIGCGTGQATLPMSRRGLAVTAVELGSALAEVARRNLRDFPQSRIITGSFEDWPLPATSFAAAVAFNMMHWIDPALRYAKPAQALRPSGFLVVGSTHVVQPADADQFWRDVQADYHAVDWDGAPLTPEQVGPGHLPAEAEPYFEQVAARRYPFHHRIPARDHLANMAIQSGTRQLGPAREAELLSRVGRRLESLGWPDLTINFVGQLVIAKLRP